MTLDEAIQHCYQRAEENRIECEECAKEHEQLAGWLEELKQYREGSKMECEFCKFEMLDDTEYPCSDCKLNHLNRFEAKCTGGEDEVN